MGSQFPAGQQPPANDPLDVPPRVPLFVSATVPAPAAVPYPGSDPPPGPEPARGPSPAPPAPSGPDLA